MDRLFSTFQTASKALALQRQRVQIASENLANANTTRTESGRAYQPKTLQIERAENSVFGETLRSRLQLKTSSGLHLGSSNAPLRGEGPQSAAPQVTEVSQARYRYEYDPSHPDADENGMVEYPDVDMVEEMTRLVSANRLYEANLSVIESEKEIIKRSFEI